MMSPRAVVVIAAVTVAAGACSRRAATGGDDGGTVRAADLAGWRADLAYLAAELPRRHPAAFFHLGEPAFRAAVAALDRDLAGLDPAGRTVGFGRLVASLGDAHTGASAPPFLAGGYPLETYRFDDGVVVIAAPTAPWAVGARLVAVGGRPIDEVTAQIAALVPHDNDAGVWNALPSALASWVVLRGLGLVGDDHQATFRLALTDGQTRELALVVGRPPASRGLTGPQLGRQHADRRYWSTYLAESRALYLQYNACAEDPAQPFAGFVAAALASPGAAPVERLIIDLRYNGGGNSEIMRPLLTALAARTELRGRLFVLTGRATFSSAILNAIALDRDLGAVLVGEPTAGRPSHYGEVQSFVLPHSKIRVTHSTKYHANPGYDGDTLAPELRVPVTAVDHAAGRDAALAAALAAPVPMPSSR